MSDLDFQLDVRSPSSRHLGVTLTLPRAALAAAAGSAPGDTLGDLFLPTWTPGSYLIREYSRQLSRVVAEDADTGAALGCDKVAKNRWRLRGAGTTQRVRVRYQVHAHELSVRTADVTGEHAYWNHACVLLWPVGGEHLAARLQVLAPAGWRLACALPADGAATAAGPGATAHHLRATDLHHAVDSPCLLGTLQAHEFVEAGVPHTIWLDGLGPIQPPAHFVDDFRAIVRSAAAVFGGELPYRRYQFLCLFAADGHGGLEHADSTTLLMGRTALRSDKGYAEFLALAAHELFHAWNVKRLRPREFWTYDYERENYTQLLWLIEGWTAYYDDLLCRRAGLVAPAAYLETVAKNIGGLLGAPGRHALSLAESSFDAWIRLYRPDANTRNSSQNYYGNGAVAALVLDLFLRRESGGRHCLDDVLRDLYASTFAAGRGYELADVQRAIAAVGGDAAVRLVRQLTEGPLDPDLAAVFAGCGLRMAVRDADRCFLGVSFEANSTVIAAVTAGTPAHAAGLAPGDEILALDGLRVDSARWADVFQAVARIDRPLTVLLARRGLVQQLQAVPKANPGTIALEIDPQATPAAVRLRDGWLCQQTPTRPTALPG